MNIGTKLRGLREDRDLTQQDIADYLQIDRKTYNRYEQSKHEIKVDVIVKLAVYYNISMDYICGITNYETPLKTEDNSIIRNKLTSKQILLLEKYEKNKDLQKAVDKLLDIK